MWDRGSAALGFSQQRCMSPLPGIDCGGSSLKIITSCSKKLRESVVLLIVLNMSYMRRLCVDRA